MHLMGESLNLMTLLSGLMIGMPSYWSLFDSMTAPVGKGGLISIERWQQLLAALAVLIPAGLFVGSMWLGGIVHLLARDARGFTAYWRRTGWIWLNVGLFTLLLVGILLASFFVLSLFSLVGMLLAGVSGATMAVWALFFVGSLFGLWLAIGLRFVVQAIALDRVNMVRAIWRSLNVVGRNTSSTLGFILISFLLVQGFARIWLAINGSTWGISLGMLGNAYLGASLTAAAFYFYRSRYQYWQQNKPPLPSPVTRDTPPPPAH